jgi:hypothetical protein
MDIEDSLIFKGRTNRKKSSIQKLFIIEKRAIKMKRMPLVDLRFNDTPEMLRAQNLRKLQSLSLVAAYFGSVY